MFKNKKRIFIISIIIIIVVMIAALAGLRSWQVKNCPEVVGGMPGGAYQIKYVSPWCSGYSQRLPS